MHIADEPYNFAHWRFSRIDRSIGNNAFADRIFAGEKLFGEAFIHNHNWWSVPIVSIGEGSAAPERDLHRFQITRRDCLPLRHRLLSRRHWLLLKIEIKCN